MSKMKVALICPSNLLYMPYVDNYEKIFKQNDIEYKKINWDRLQIEESSKYTYKDNKTGHQRNYIDYLKFKRFIVKILRQDKYEKVIVFGLQLTYFLKRTLSKHYNYKYIIDIRDYNKILKIYNMKNIIENSMMTVISSPGYLEWLPNSDKYVINHNTNIDELDSLSDYKLIKDDKAITISYIGTLVNFDENKELIDNLKNNKRFNILFWGDGMINGNIEEYITENHINNVSVHGRYKSDQEKNLYNQSDLTNMLLYNNTINNRTCLANRVYKSTLYGKPMIALSGTYISKLIIEYNLGLIVNSFEDIDKDIISFLNQFDKEKYDSSRIRFFEDIIKENKLFEKQLINSICYKI